MKDNAIEKEIQDKGLTAPRVTPDRLEEVIKDEQYHAFPGSTFTSCLLTLENGFTVHGESACASPENFDAELGAKIARDNAKNKIWALEGYLLKQKLHEEPVDFKGRLLKEREDLEDKTTKLGDFINNGQPAFIDGKQWALLNHQYGHMVKYHSILVTRIKLIS
ncbi:hypothetical protein NVP1013O_67 [Vibrio phage 1.013.O._10N.286.54.F9]|nr:hypothetical protein NVP1013O_67 [Vibrio phage 1.013.O._10N.286.54.F9]